MSTAQLPDSQWPSLVVKRVAELPRKLARAAGERGERSPDQIPFVLSLEYRRWLTPSQSKAVLVEMLEQGEHAWTVICRRRYQIGWPLPLAPGQCRG